MLRVLTSLFLGRSLADGNGAGTDEVSSGLAPFPPMQPLVPPPAGNDDGLAGMRFEIERELRSAGYLQTAV